MSEGRAVMHQTFCPQSILVTGGCGFIGSNFVRQVVQEHPDVRICVLDSLTYAGNAHNLDGLPSERVYLAVGDVCDGPLLDGLLADCDAVVHFAAESHVDASISGPDPFLHTNVEGTFCLLEALRRCHERGHEVRLHHVSTDEVFGDLPIGEGGRFEEASPYRPSSPYSATKASSDLLVRAWVRTYGLSATISYCCNNYGPYQHVEKFVPQVITSVLRGKRPRLYGDGQNVRDWIHVADHCSAVWDVLTRGQVGETYAIGAGCERSNLEVLRVILRLMGCDKDWFDYVADRPGHDRRYALDASKIRCELGWRPRHVNFKAGLAETIAWYEEHEGWWRGAGGE